MTNVSLIKLGQFLYLENMENVQCTDQIGLFYGFREMSPLRVTYPDDCYFYK